MMVALGLSLFCLIISFGSSKQNKTNNLGWYYGTMDEFPFIVSLQYETGAHFCSGTIIGSELILTSARCVNNEYRFNIKAGESDQFTAATYRNPELIFVHPLYRKYHYEEYDAAVVKLSEPLPLSSTITVVQLPALSKIVPTVECKVAGWGHVKHGAELISRYLRARTLKIYSQAECNKFIHSKASIFCAGCEACDEVTSYGHHGGPLVVDGIIYGIISRQIPSSESGLPSLATNVPLIMEWINEVFHAMSS